MRSSWLWTAVILAVVGGGSYALYIYLRPEPLPEQVLYGNGHIEGTEIRVSSEIAGRVVENLLVEGLTIAAGQLLVRLDGSDLVLQKERVGAEINALARDKERAAGELEVWRHHVTTAESELERYRELQERGNAPTQRVEQAEDSHQQTRGRVATLEAEIAATDARIEAVRKELALVQSRLDKAEIVAPTGGTVLVKAVEQGEFLQPGETVAVLVDLSEVELKVFVPQKDIGKVLLGAPARVRVDAFPDRLFTATVSRVDQTAQFTPRDIHMPEERVRMVFGVTLAIDNPEGTLKPGMPADAWILWRASAGWPERLFVPE